MMLTDLLFSNAWAQDAAAAAPQADWTTLLVSYLPIVFIFVIFYLLIIKPQNESAKAHAKMVKELKKGDMVLIDGGLIGEVSKVMEEILHLRVNADAEVAVARASVKKLVKAEDVKGWEVHAPTKQKRG